MIHRRWVPELSERSDRNGLLPPAQLPPQQSRIPAYRLLISDVPPLSGDPRALFG